MPLEIRLWETFAGFFWVRIRETQQALGLLSCWSGSGEEWIQWKPRAQQCTLCAKCKLPHRALPMSPKSVPRVRNFGFSHGVIWFTKLAKFGSFLLCTCTAHGVAVARAELLFLVHSAVIVWRPQGAVPKPTLCFEARRWVHSQCIGAGAPASSMVYV